MGNSKRSTGKGELKSSTGTEGRTLLTTEMCTNDIVSREKYYLLSWVRRPTYGVNNVLRGPFGLSVEASIGRGWYGSPDNTTRGDGLRFASDLGT